MGPVLFLTAGHTKALQYAQSLLLQQGFSFTDLPTNAVTHLLLPVPSFDETGAIKGGGDLAKLLAQLPRNVTIIGGNLHHLVLNGYRTIDLLQEPLYLSQNARITAHCAVTLAAGQLEQCLDEVEVLVIGWGRIGKCLAHLLKAIGASVTLAARKETDRATLASLGYTAIDTAQIEPERYDLIFNTVPIMLLPDCPGNAVKIDLASSPGISGTKVIWARGLPNQHAPESSGRLIARSVISHLTETEAIL